MITIHPDAKTILNQYKNNQLALAQIHMGISFSVMQDVEKNFTAFSKTHSQIIEYCEADLAERLTPHFGKSIGKVEGKYRKADFFAFECQDQTIICIPEKGDRGTAWMVVLSPSMPRNRHRGLIEIEDDLFIDVLPAFFTELNEILYGEDLHPGGFSDEANVLRQQWRTPQATSEAKPTKHIKP